MWWYPLVVQIFRVKIAFIETWPMVPQVHLSTYLQYWSWPTCLWIFILICKGFSRLDNNCHLHSRKLYNIWPDIYRGHLLVMTNLTIDVVWWRSGKRSLSFGNILSTNRASNLPKNMNCAKHLCISSSKREIIRIIWLFTFYLKVFQISNNQYISIKSNKDFIIWNILFLKKILVSGL